MSTDVDWKNTLSGSWFTAANWSGGKVPVAGNQVTLTSKSPVTISYNGTDTVAALISTDDHLDIQGGKLTITQDAALAGGFTMTGGTLSLGGAANSFSGGIDISTGDIVLGHADALSIAGTGTLGAANSAYGATIQGAGTLSTSGLIDIVEDGYTNEAAFGGGLVWNNTGTIVDSGIFTADFTAGIAFSILNQAHAVFDFTTDVACLMNGSMNGAVASSDFKNAGLLEKTGGTFTTTFYATITSTGTILVTTGTLDIEDGGLIGGTIEGPGVLQLDGGGTLSNARAIDTNIDIGGGVATLSGLTASGVMVVDSTIDQTGTVTFGSGTQGGVIYVKGIYDITGADGIASGASNSAFDILSGLLAKTGSHSNVTIATPVYDGSTIAVDAGALLIAQALSGTGSVTIAGGATFEAGASVISSITATLGLGSELILDEPGAFAGKIASFVAGTTLDVRGLDVTYATASSGGTLTLEHTGTIVGKLLLTNNDSGAKFTYASDNHGGTLLEISGAAAVATKRSPARMDFLAAPAATSAHAESPLNSYDPMAAAMVVQRAEVTPTGPLLVDGAISLSGTTGAFPVLDHHSHAAWMPNPF